MKYVEPSILSVNRREVTDISWSTTLTLMLLTSIVAAQGNIRMMTVGNITAILGMNELRKNCLNSFCMRYFSIMAYSNLFLNFLRLNVIIATDIKAIMLSSVSTNCIGRPSIIIFLTAEMYHLAVKIHDIY